MVILVWLLPQPESDDDLLSAAEVAQMVGVAERTLLERKAGTATLPRQPGRPARYRRGDVREWLRARAERVAPAKRKSVQLLTRKKRSMQLEPHAPG